MPSMFYNTPNCSWKNQPRSYWVPVRIMARVWAYIRTSVSSALLKVGRKWTGYDVTSERVD
jgi:hypothetical protein